MKPSKFQDQIDFASMSVLPFNKLVKLVARAFYDDKHDNKPENQRRNGRSDNRGMAIVILDALTRRLWVREDDLAKDLKLSSKQLRQTLSYFEEENLVTRVTRRETVKAAQRFNAALANTADGHGEEGEEKKKVHTHSYCCLDYSQICDVVRYRLHHMRKKLEDELGCGNTVEEYVCCGCKRKYNALDALQLISPTDEGFCCENCNGELKLAADEMGGGNGNARGRRREMLKGMLQKMEEQLKPLQDQLNLVEHLTCPEFRTLEEWEALASAAHRDATDPSKSSQEYVGTLLPFIGETKVDVELYGAAVKEEDIKPEVGLMKVYPPWMIQQGMNLTKGQCGEVLSSDRQVGMKSKREDVEWEAAWTTGMATETCKLHDVKAEESEEDEIDWEDG
ncbi:hypothetical protein MKW98_017088 [Papaver atlanticum]|uniref:HTH TFE/IIEalpha-type domain-containing protein n=1 Tax=Papaver atlanticum TaxID=357466 RepID=A0AAD4THR4_9MAGN|nr:hypothetical protein MKW98_017088 [Papaver atlanticum]